MTYCASSMVSSKAGHEFSLARLRRAGASSLMHASVAVHMRVIILAVVS